MLLCYQYSNSYGVYFPLHTETFGIIKLNYIGGVADCIIRSMSVKQINKYREHVNRQKQGEKEKYLKSKNNLF